MHLEEVGIDPLDRDAAGYRERIRELIYRRRAFILTDRERIVFKTELSAITSRAAQLMGVWTAPDARRKGFARRGLAEICGHLVHRGQAVTLFVNDFNAPAIALYESLGFRRIGCNRALIW
jgi:predicted GNAT family acetyltransferase